MPTEDEIKDVLTASGQQVLDLLAHGDLNAARELAFSFSSNYHEDGLPTGQPQMAGRFHKAGYVIAYYMYFFCASDNRFIHQERVEAGLATPEQEERYYRSQDSMWNDLCRGLSSV